jgi:hypothetical protein
VHDDQFAVDDDLVGLERQIGEHAPQPQRGRVEPVGARLAGSRRLGDGLSVDRVGVDDASEVVDVAANHDVKRQVREGACVGRGRWCRGGQRGHGAFLS